MPIDENGDGILDENIVFILEDDQQQSEYELNVELNEDVVMSEPSEVSSVFDISQIEYSYAQSSLDDSSILDISIEDQNISPSSLNNSRTQYFQSQKNSKRKEVQLEGIIKTFSSPVKNKVLLKSACSRPKIVNEIMKSNPQFKTLTV